MSSSPTGTRGEALTPRLFSVTAIVGVLVFHRLVGRIGNRQLLAASYGLMGLGSAVFALTPNWPLALFAAFVVGLGFGGIDYGLNPLFSVAFGRRGADNYPWIFGGGHRDGCRRVGADTSGGHRLHRSAPTVRGAGAYVIAASMIGGVAFPPLLGTAIDVAGVRALPLVPVVLALICVVVSGWLARTTEEAER